MADIFTLPPDVRRIIFAHVVADFYGKHYPWRSLHGPFSLHDWMFEYLDELSLVHPIFKRELDNQRVLFNNQKQGWKFSRGFIAVIREAGHYHLLSNTLY